MCCNKRILFYCNSTQKKPKCTQFYILRKNKARKVNWSGWYCIVYIHILTMHTSMFLARLTRNCSHTCLYQSKNNQCWFTILIKLLALLEKKSKYTFFKYEALEVFLWVSLFLLVVLLHISISSVACRNVLSCIWTYSVSRTNQKISKS